VAERDDRERVPIEELIDLEALREGGREPTPARLRAALPRGWVLEDDQRHARRDLRLFFREAWILVAGLVIFGSSAVLLFWSTFPRGWSGVVRALVLVGVMVLIGGLVAPTITRALNRR